MHVAVNSFFTFPLHPRELHFPTVMVLVFLVYVLYKGFKVRKRFIIHYSRLSTPFIADRT